MNDNIPDYPPPAYSPSEGPPPAYEAKTKAQKPDVHSAESPSIGTSPFHAKTKPKEKTPATQEFGKRMPEKDIPGGDGKPRRSTRIPPGKETGNAMRAAKIGGPI